MTDSEDTTGAWLFQRYASPCADNISNTTISAEVREEFYRLSDDSGTINPDLMEKFFPKATKTLYLCAEETGLPPWSLKNVQKYWREKHHGESPVEKVTLIREKRLDDTPPAWQVAMGGVQVIGWVFNTYELPLQPGQEVYTHLCSIIEIA